MKWLDGIINSTDMNLGKLQEMMRVREACHAAVHGVAESNVTWRLNKNKLTSFCIEKETIKKKQKDNLENGRKYLPMMGLMRQII